MAEFYRLPHWILTTLVMIVTLCIVLQTQTISYSVRRLKNGWVRRVENGLECMILLTLFIFAALLAQVQYALFCGFLAPSAYHFLRQLVFLLLAVLGVTVTIGTEMIWPFFTIGGATLLLPVTEKVLGTAYPGFFMASILFFLIRSAHICLIRRREIRTQISSASVKEAIDILHTGLLFFRQNGTILLCNHRMDMLAKEMMGMPLQNGKKFQEFLECGTLLGDCKREILGGQQVFRLSDSSVWSISSYDIPLRHRTLIL